MSETPPPKSRLGRIIAGSLVYGVGAVLALILTISVAQSLYGAPPKAVAQHNLSSKERAWCFRRLSGLRDELERQLQLEVRKPPRHGPPLGRWEHWSKGWRRGLTEARRRCGEADATNAHTAAGRLEAMYDAYNAGLTGIRQRGGTLHEELQEALEALRGG